MFRQLYNRPPFALYLGIFFALNPTNSVLGQHRFDQVWTLGYGKKFTAPNGIVVGGIVFDFNFQPPLLTYDDFILKEPLASISDSSGQLLAYTDGCDIANRNHTIMMNGDSLSPGKVFNEFCNNLPYPVYQGALFLPLPDSKTEYYLFHLSEDDWLWAPRYLLYSAIDQLGDNGKGEVIQKNQLVFEDIELSHYLTATRHANGRDWWIVAPRRKSNVYQCCLLTPKGVTYVGSQTIGLADTIYWAGQTTFTPDGSKYFKNLLEGFHIMDFDRCTGMFSNYQFLPHPEPAGAGGVAVSPSGQFLYTTDGSNLYQFDLWAVNIAASRQLVAVYDGHLSPFPTAFYQCMLAPDGKIYISTGSSNNVMHIIHHPDLPGDSCEVEQHGLALPALMDFPVPNFVHYNLGPLDCSACDTLELDNLPQAAWSYEMDTSVLRTIAFRDLSYCAQSWSWDFGDGSTPGSEQNPVHTYSDPGPYIVCLTVSNIAGTDTHCDTIYISSTGVIDPDLNRRISVWPNPFKEQISVVWSGRLPEPVFHLYDYTGRQVQSHQLNYGVTELASITLVPGLYFWEVSSRGQRLKSGRLVKLTIGQ